MDIEYLIRIVNNDMNIKKRFAKNAQLAQSAISGFLRLKDFFLRRHIPTTSTHKPH